MSDNCCIIISAEHLPGTAVGLALTGHRAVHCCFTLVLHHLHWQQTLDGIFFYLFVDDFWVGMYQIIAQRCHWYWDLLINCGYTIRRRLRVVVFILNSHCDKVYSFAPPKNFSSVQGFNILVNKNAVINQLNLLKFFFCFFVYVYHVL